jgi:N6-adenosine-specific RNA methylase IME4
MLYQTIVADPPWNERGGGKIKRGADKHYPLQKIEGIVAFGAPLQQYLADDAFLFLWVTNTFVANQKCFDVIDAWGFRAVTLRTWAKESIGIGQWTRGQTEQMFFCVRGKPGYRIDETTGKRKQLSTLIGGSIIPRPRCPITNKLIHSRKPDIAREEIDWYAPGPILEMYCRVRFESNYDKTWHCWGNEIDSDVELCRVANEGQS